MRDDHRLRIGREIFLAAFGLPLDSVDPWILDRMTSILDEQEFRAGQTLFGAGEPVEFLYFMQDGRVRFTRVDGPSWILRGRWVLGSFEAIGDRPVAHTATALADFNGMRVSTAEWVEMLEDSFPVARSAVINGSRATARLEERVAREDPVSPDGASRPPVVAPATLGLAERLALLLDVRMLRLGGVQALADLAAVSRQVSFAAGELILERGRSHEHLTLIVDGDVVAEREDPSVVRRMGPGDLVCGTAILGGIADGWQARCMTPARGISFPIAALFDLMEEHFDLVRSTLAALSARRQLLLEHLAAKTPDLEIT
jgi:CRP-like cAMP-binding protein